MNTQVHISPTRPIPPGITTTRPACRSSRSTRRLARLAKRLRVSLLVSPQTRRATSLCRTMLVLHVRVAWLRPLFVLLMVGINDVGSAIAGTNSSWMPHKGVLSPAEKSLYISTSDGAGPYDGTLVSASSTMSDSCLTVISSSLGCCVQVQHHFWHDQGYHSRLRW